MAVQKSSKSKFKLFGTVRQLPSGRYQARYTSPAGEQLTVRGTFPDQITARNRLHEIEVDIRRGDYWDNRKARITFREFMKKYMEFRATQVRETERRNNESYLKVHLNPAFGNLRMDQITSEKVDAWWSSQPPREIRRVCYGFLRHAMKYALRWGYIRTNPCMVEEPSKAVGPARPTWSVEQFYEVLEKVPAHLHAPLHVMFAGHLRLGELIALNADDYDYETGELTVTKQKNSLGQTTETKTGLSKTIVLLDNGIEALAAAPRRIGATPLFAGERGERLNRITLRKRWNAAVAETGYENFHLHDLRHIGLSLVAASNAPLKDLMERGGHRSIGGVMRYQHTDKQRHKKLARKVSKALRDQHTSKTSDK
ncbi:MAG: site-specific integrase [Microbacteriaceae bacterium]|nr:site-specific integrase [Microbacteriaceae bacterium]MCL2793949.1 site-specific integrase [Microbacteriaceae bacterium]